VLIGEQFGRLFETFERTVFRLETLAEYDVEDEREEIARFLAGEDMGPEWDDNPRVRSMTDKGSCRRSRTAGPCPPSRTST
jgi:hypothetical protein